MHDTFLKAWASLDGFRPRREGSLGAWLCRIASHLAVDELRRDRHFPVVPEAEIPDPVRQDESEEAPVDPDRLRQVPVEELIDLVATLPEGYRMVFNLFCLDGCSHREIARLLGISEKTSQTQYLKARRRLASLLAEKYGKDEK